MSPPIEKTAETLVALGDLLYRLSIPVSPSQKSVRAWMKEPLAGDLVVVLFDRGQQPLKRVGRLLCHERRQFDDWEEGYEERWGEPVPSRPVWIIKGLDGREHTWENCEVIRIPETLSELPI